MKHFRLKFNHGVEIGAHLAYVGHFRRVKDRNVFAISQDEIEHRANIRWVLTAHGQQPSEVIDCIFTLVGNAIRIACRWSPEWALNFIARSMEAFAVFNYERLARDYPAYRTLFEEMAEAEELHRLYFAGGVGKPSNR